VVVFGDQRLAEFPDVPSSREKGVSDVNALNSIFSVVVHRDTPPDRITFLEDLVKKVAEDPEFRKLATNMQLNAVYTGPKEAAEGVERMRAVGTPLLKQLKLYVEQ
jgi:tripartite-type tricarboxylate transporter receptor subunit TctC